MLWYDEGDAEDDDVKMLLSVGSRSWYISSHSGVFRWCWWSACLCHRSGTWHQNCLHSQVSFITTTLFCFHLYKYNIIYCV